MRHVCLNFYKSVQWGTQHTFNLNKKAEPECWHISFSHKIAIPLGEMVYCSEDICGVGPEG